MKNHIWRFFLVFLGFAGYMQGFLQLSIAMHEESLGAEFLIPVLVGFQFFREARHFDSGPPTGSLLESTLGGITAILLLLMSFMTLMGFVMSIITFLSDVLGAFLFSVPKGIRLSELGFLDCYYWAWLLWSLLAWKNIKKSSDLF